MLLLQNPPLLFAHAPAVGAERIRRIVASTGATEIAARHAPAWFIDDRIEMQPVRRLPQLLRVGLATDPWSWYARVYRLGLEGGHRPRAALRAWGRGSLRLRDVVYGMTHPEDLGYASVFASGSADSAARASVGGDIPQPLGVVWEPDEDGGWSGLLASTLGLCSFTLLYHYGRKREWRDPQERPEWAIDLLLDTSAPDVAIDWLLSQKPGPVPRLPPRPPPAPLQAAFDREMIQWVEQAERPLVRLMGYGRPFGPAAGPVARLARLGALRTGGTTTE